MRTIRILVLLATTTACASPALRPRPTEPGPARKPARPVEEARVRPPAAPAPSRPAATRADDGPLTGKIDSATPAGRAAALRLTEEGRQRLAAGEAARAIELLERAVAVDARVPYAYYFLARAHAANGRRDLAYRFLDRAEQKLAGEPYWRSEVERMRGQLLGEDGKTAASDAAYRRALDAWPGNRAASEALTAGGRRGKESP